MWILSIHMSNVVKSKRDGKSTTCNWKNLREITITLKSPWREDSSKTHRWLTVLACQTSVIVKMARKFFGSSLLKTMEFPTVWTIHFLHSSFYISWQTANILRVRSFNTIAVNQKPEVIHEMTGKFIDFCLIICFYRSSFIQVCPADQRRT